MKRKSSKKVPAAAPAAPEVHQHKPFPSLSTELLVTRRRILEAEVISSVKRFTEETGMIVDSIHLNIEQRESWNIPLAEGHVATGVSPADMRIRVFAKARLP